MSPVEVNRTGFAATCCEKANFPRLSMQIRQWEKSKRKSQTLPERWAIFLTEICSVFNKIVGSLYRGNLHDHNMIIILGPDLHIFGPLRAEKAKPPKRLFKLRFRAPRFFEYWTNQIYKTRHHTLDFFGDKIAHNLKTPQKSFWSFCSCWKT